MAGKKDSIQVLSTLIQKGIDNRLKDLHTSMPGIIQSFDAAQQIATVQPAIKRIFKAFDGDKEILTPSGLPLLINVPVQFPRGGGFSLTFPVKKGDECLLVFCERSIDNWHEKGGLRDPAGKRFHHLSDATAFVGISSKPNKVPSYDATNTELKKDDGSVSIKLLTDGTMELKAGTKITLDTPDTVLTGNLDVQGSTTLTENVTSNGTNISNTHVHPQGPDSDGDSQQNTGGPQ